MIKISNLNKVFKNKKRKIKALDNINITFDSKGLCFILGSSGAGKTTFLNILSLQSKPTSGSMVIDDLDTSKLSDLKLASIRNNYFGIVFQELNLIEDFNVYQNIIIGLEIQKKTIDKEEVIQILKNLNLPDNILEEKIYNLSGGQKQRVAIARALIKDSKVIICDEPTGSLDETNSIEIMKILKDISKDRLVIVVSHNNTLANEFGDRIITLVDGQIKSDTNTIIESSDTNKMVMNKKVHLPFKFVSKIALSTFKNCIPKLVFALISLILTIGVFLFAVSLYLYNPIDTAVSALEDENIKYIDLQKYNNSNISYFTKSDLEKIDEVYKGEYILSHFSDEMSISTSSNINHEMDRYTRRIKNTTYLSEEMLEKCNFSIVGRLPQYNEEVIEVALTEFECYYFGWLEMEDLDDTSEIQKIINEKVFKYKHYTGKNFEILTCKISGVIDTNYKYYTEYSYHNSIRDKVQTEHEMHNDIFVCNEMFNQIIQTSIDNNYASEIIYNDIYLLTENKNYLDLERLNSLFNENIEIKAITQIDYIVSASEGNSQNFGKLSLIGSLILGIISLFTFIGLIRTSIDINKRKMKILRSIGITIIDSNNIFSLQTLLFTFISVILSIIPCNICMFILNNHTKNYLNATIDVVHLSFIALLLTFLGLLVVSILITTIINIIKFNDKKLKIVEE